MRLALAFGMVVSPYCASLMLAQPTSPEGAFEWHGPVARGSFIEIRGINGNVRAVASTSGEVEVLAKIDGQETASSVKVQLIQHDNGVTVCSVFPGEKECRPLGRPRSRNPCGLYRSCAGGLSFLGSTVNGGVEAESLKSDVQAYTVNGQVRVSLQVRFGPRP